MENENQVVEATNSTEEVVDTTTDIVAGETTEQTEELVPKAQFNQVLARAKKAEEALKKMKPITKQEVVAESPDKSFSREELNLRLDGYTEEEVNFIMRNGGKKELANANSPVAIAIKGMKEQRRAEEAASKTVSISGSSEVERKYSQEQLSKMTLKELEAILPKAGQ